VKGVLEPPKMATGRIVLFFISIKLPLIDIYLPVGRIALMKSKINIDMKSKALGLARDSLQTMGFSGFSFQTIADSLGIRKASLHYYFSSKEEMGLSLLESYIEGHKAWAEKVQDLRADEKLKKMINLFIRLAQKDQKICPVGSFAAEFNSLSPKLRKKIKEFHLVIRDWIKETIDQGKKEKSIKNKTDSKILADLFLSTLQGAVQLARVKGDIEAQKDVYDNLFMLLF
jgi:TetR/AcrR family transcriptional repressor of nem operon